MHEKNNEKHVVGSPDPTFARRMDECERLIQRVYDERTAAHAHVSRRFVEYWLDRCDLRSPLERAAYPGWLMFAHMNRFASPFGGRGGGWPSTGRGDRSLMTALSKLPGSLASDPQYGHVDIVVPGYCNSGVHVDFRVQAVREARPFAAVGTVGPVRR